MGEDIRLKSKAGEIGAYLATPKGTPKGGVVVIQEIFGVNHHIKAVTDKFAADRLPALAPHFFDHVKTGVDLGYTPDTIAEGRKYVTELGFDKPVQDVEAAIQELKKRGVKKVAVTGFAGAAPSPAGGDAACPTRRSAITAAASTAPRTRSPPCRPCRISATGHAHPDDARTSSELHRRHHLRLSGRPRLPLRRARQLGRGGPQAGDGPHPGVLRQARWLSWERATPGAQSSS
jgi:dienelactone hydrolase